MIYSFRLLPFMTQRETESERASETGREGGREGEKVGGGGGEIHVIKHREVE